MVLVDTFNVLHAATKSGLGRLTPADLRELMARSRWRSEQIVLVMDGGGGRSPDRTLRHGLDAGLDLPTSGAGIHEVYAQTGGSSADADSVIEALLEREDHFGRGRQAVVISSDKRIRAAATAARAQGLSSEDFLKKLAEDVRKAHQRTIAQAGARPDFALDHSMDAGRTAYWLAQFGLTDPPAGAASTPGAPPNLCTPEPSPDDVDMDQILRTHPATPLPNPRAARRKHDDPHRPD